MGVVGWAPSLRCVLLWLDPKPVVGQPRHQSIALTLGQLLNLSVL